MKTLLSWLKAGWCQPDPYQQLPVPTLPVTPAPKQAVPPPPVQLPYPVYHLGGDWRIELDAPPKGPALLVLCLASPNRRHFWPVTTRALYYQYAEFPHN